MELLPTWAVPVLPATSYPLTRAAVPVPEVTTSRMPSLTLAAVSEETAWPRDLGLVVEVVTPSGERMWSTT